MNEPLSPQKNPAKQAPEPRKKPSSFARAAGLVFFSFIASFLGAWVFLATGLVQQDVTQTITQNRDNIVLQESELVAEVAQKVSPSVVSIISESVASSQLFGQSVQSGAGTGIIISKDGYIITNKHVLGDNNRSVEVVSSDGTSYKNVTVVGSDPLNDIAFLKISGVNNLKPAKIADSSTVEIGEKVIAIGNALGQFQTSVTSGIISGTGRPIVAQDGEQAERLEDLFQTDAAINPGNSGGPLTNLQGEVIAINTAIAEDAEGIGFAIPINSTKGLIKGVLASGKVQRAYLGVAYTTITPANADELKVSVKRGAYVGTEGADAAQAVIAGSPAAKAGIKAGDVISKVAGVAVNERNGLAGLLSQYQPGDKVELTIVRDKNERVISVTLEQFKP